MNRSYLGRIALGRDSQRAIDLAVMADGDGVARHLDLAGEPAMHTVISEQMRVGLHAAEVVDGDRNDVLAPAFHDRAQHEAPDPTKPIDRDLHWHVGSPFLSLTKTFPRLLVPGSFTDSRGDGLRRDPKVLI